MSFSPFRRTARPAARASAHGACLAFDCHVRVAAIASSLIFLVGHGQAAAQGAPATVVVTGTRTPVRADQLLADVTVLDRADIAAAEGRTLTELLARQPGLQGWANGGLGKISSLSMRGLEARHTLLLVDGVRVGSATVGTPSLDNLPLESIERIEIVRGPLSALYGSDAVGGVVQVFTRSGAGAAGGGAGDGADAVVPDAAATLGSQQLRSLAGGLRWRAGTLDAAAHAQALRSRGISATNERAPFGAFNGDRDGFEQSSATLQLGVALPGDWRAQARALQSRGESGFDDGAGADARTGLLTQLASLQAAGPVTGRWRTSVRASRAVDEFDTLATASAFTPLGVTGTTQTQFGWENTIATPAGTLLALAERLTQGVTRPGTPYATSTRRIDGVALGLHGATGAHRWQGALRRDRNSQFGTQTTGSAGYGYQLSPELLLSASWGTSFNAPSFNQLYFPGFGNPALQPEEGVHRELGLRWASGPHEVRFNAFSSGIRGYITPGQNPTNVNADIEGLGVALTTQVVGWRLEASGELIDARNSNAGNANFGKRLPRRSKETLRAGAERSFTWPSGAWTLGAQWLHGGPRFEDAANTTELAGFSVLDLRAEWAPAKDWRWGVKLNNVTDRRYETVLGYNQPGRELFVTLRYGAP
jgi:vitamin B12 transporter